MSNLYVEKTQKNGSSFCQTYQSFMNTGFITTTLTAILQAWILAMDIGRCPSKYRVMFDKDCFVEVCFFFADLWKLKSIP